MSLFMQCPRGATRPLFSSRTFSSRAYSDDFIKSVLANTKTIAMVGASANWNRPSYFAMKYMQAKGFRVIPVNPVIEGKTVLGEEAYASLEDIPSDIQIDMVDVFRKPSEVKSIAQSAINIGASVLWTQLDVVCEESESLARRAGLDVVMDRCPKIEFSRLYGELGWHGFNSGVISSKRRSSKNTESRGSRSLPKPSFDGFATKQIHAGGKFLHRK